MKKVLILGAGLLQSYVIKRAKELKYEVHVLDMNPNSIGFKYADKYQVINIVDKKKCLQYAKENNIDGIITAATDYGVLTMSYIAQKLKLPAINYNSATIIKNKYAIRNCFNKNKVDNMKQFYEITKLKQLDNIKDTIIYPVMVKPCDGSGSKAVKKVENFTQLLKATSESLNVSLSKKALIEDYIEGNEYGVESFVYNNDIYILTIMKKTMTKPPYYAELGHSVPSGLTKTIEDKVKRTVKKAIKALKIDFGAVNMDLLINNAGNVYIVDVGARMGGNLIGSHIIPLSTGIDYLGNIIKSAVGDNVDFKSKLKTCVATKILALTPGTVASLPRFNKYYSDEIKYIVCTLSLGDTINAYKNNLDGCGYIVATGNDIKFLEKSVSDTKEIIDNCIIRK